MATMPAASIPHIYDRIRPGFVSELAEDARVEQEDDVALLTREIAPLAARDGAHGAGLERFDVLLLTRTAQDVRVHKLRIDSDFAEAARLLEAGSDRLDEHLAEVTERSQEYLTEEAQERRSQGTSRLSQESAYVKALVHQTTGMRAILAERAAAGRCQQNIGQMTQDQQLAEYKEEEKFRIRQRERACLTTAAELQSTQEYCDRLKQIKDELDVSGHVDTCKRCARDRLSAVKAMVAERRQHIEGIEALETELSAEYDRAKEDDRRDEANLKDLLERLLAANKAHRASRMRKHMVGLRLEALRQNVQREKDEMGAVVQETEVADDAYTSGVADVEERRREFLAARQSTGREAVDHVRPAALEDALNVSLALTVLQRAKDSKAEERLALQEQKSDVERRLEEAIRRREDPATASEEARRAALYLPDEKAALEESIRQCEEDSRVFQEHETAGEELRRLLSSFSEFGLEMPWEELKTQAQREADECFETFPGLFKRGDRPRSPTRDSVATSASSSTEGQLALVNQDVMTQIEQLVERRVKEQLAREKAEREAKKAAKRRAQQEGRASASSSRSESTGSSDVAPGESRFKGDAQNGQSVSTSDGGSDD